jgi:hypothetical protein
VREQRVLLTLDEATLLALEARILGLSDLIDRGYRVAADLPAPRYSGTDTREVTFDQGLGSATRQRGSGAAAGREIWDDGRV